MWLIRYYYDVESDKVYDVDFGAEEIMIEGHHIVLANNFYSFLQQYYENITT